MPHMMLALYCTTVFVSAALLFWVQPLVGKLVLPLLGGTPETWNTCMVFFQAALLAGAGRDGTISTASPSSTGLPSTTHTLSKRARRLAG